MADFVIRRAERSDLPALGRLGAVLMRLHYEFDPDRFLAPGDHPEEGYAAFLGRELDSAGSAVFVAARGEEVVGYVYAGVEPRSWKELRDTAGFVHDLVVTDRARRMGAGSALLDGAIAWLRAQGVRRVMLWTADRNAAARALFASRGFRYTMVEMTKEL